MSSSSPSSSSFLKSGDRRPSGLEQPDVVATPLTNKLVVVMVGLPARGKTYIATKLAYYLCWVMLPAKVFNLGAYRRNYLGAQTPSQFFHPDNKEGSNLRRDLALKAVDDMLWYLRNGGAVGIFDATNSSRERRELIYNKLTAQGVQVFFCESVCENENQISSNIIQVKINLPDYSQSSVDEAVKDFKERIDFYRAIYQPLSLDNDKQYSFIKMVDVGRYFVVHRIEGYLQMRISRFLMNLHVESRSIYLTRHGESVFNTLGRIGGDSPLSPRGHEYAQRLKQFMDREPTKNLKIWCSTLLRTIQTAAPFGHCESWKALDELDAGSCDGKTYEEIKLKMPELYKQREEDKYHTRYAQGESYGDVVQRLEPRLLELERIRDDVLIICHQAVLRCLLAYFQHLSNLAEDLPYLNVPLHTVFKITPIPYGNRIEIYDLGVSAVNTHRPRCSPAEVDLSKHSPPQISRLETSLDEEPADTAAGMDPSSMAADADADGVDASGSESDSETPDIVERLAPAAQKPQRTPRSRDHSSKELGVARGKDANAELERGYDSDESGSSGSGGAISLALPPSSAKPTPAGNQDPPSTVIVMSPLDSIRGVMHPVKLRNRHASDGDSDSVAKSK